MKWRIALALAALLPAAAIALRDGRLSDDELDQLAGLLADALAGVLRS